MHLNVFSMFDLICMDFRAVSGSSDSLDITLDNALSCVRLLCFGSTIIWTERVRLAVAEQTELFQ